MQLIETPFPLPFWNPDGVGTGWGSQKESASGWERGGGSQKIEKTGWEWGGGLRKLEKRGGSGVGSCGLLKCRPLNLVLGKVQGAELKLSPLYSAIGGDNLSSAPCRERKPRKKTPEMRGNKS